MFFVNLAVAGVAGVFAFFLTVGWFLLRLLAGWLWAVVVFIFEETADLIGTAIENWKWWRYKRKYLREPWPQKPAPPPQWEKQPEPDAEPETVVIIEGFTWPPRGAYRIRRRF